MTIVVAEDDKLTCELVVKICLESRLDVIGHATSGQEAIDIVIKKKPEALVIDIGLPIKDGFQVINEIRGAQLHPRILVLSGHSNHYINFCLTDLGIRAYLNKASCSISK